MSRPLPRIPGRASGDRSAAVSAGTMDALIRSQNQRTGIESGQPFSMDWCRVFTRLQIRQEIARGTIPDDEENSPRLACRQVVDRTGDARESKVPSMWLELVNVASKDQEYRDLIGRPVLVYFPQLEHLCRNDRKTCLDYEHYFQKDARIPVFFNGKSSRWEGIAPVKGLTMDLVKFCLPLGGVQPPEPVVLCEGQRDEDCNIEPTPPADLNCCLYDGTMIRYEPGCGDNYRCTTDSTREDVWLYCNNLGELAGNYTECFWSQRIDDAHELEFCKNIDIGNPSFTFRMLKETRPVYALPCCACGCPEKELYINLYQFIPPLDPDVHFTQKECPAIDGVRATMTIKETTDLGDNTRQYVAYWCQEEEVPVVVTLWEIDSPEPGGPQTVYVQHDSLSGQPIAAYYDSGEVISGHGGCCMVPASLESLDFNGMTNTGFLDVVWLYEGSGTGRGECTPQYHTQTFCYKMIVNCQDTGSTSSGDLFNAIIKEAHPPGHAIYDGTGENESDLDLDDFGAGLYAYGDNYGDGQLNECPGRFWFSLNATSRVLGKSDLTQNVDLPGGGMGNFSFPSATIQWPNQYVHVLGGCCQGPFVTATASSGNCNAGDTNSVSCECCKEPAGCDEETTGGTPECAPWLLAKVTWDCGKDNMEMEDP